MKDSQELQILKEAVNLGLNNLGFEEKEKVMHCFRTVQVQLQQFSELKETNDKLRAAYDELSLETEQLRADFKKVDGKPKKVLTK